MFTVESENGCRRLVFSHLEMRNIERAGGSHHVEEYGSCRRLEAAGDEWQPLMDIPQPVCSAALKEGAYHWHSSDQEAGSRMR